MRSGRKPAVVALVLVACSPPCATARDTTRRLESAMAALHPRLASDDKLNENHGMTPQRALRVASNKRSKPTGERASAKGSRYQKTAKHQHQTAGRTKQHSVDVSTHAVKDDAWPPALSLASGRKTCKISDFLPMEEHFDVPVEGIRDIFNLSSVLNSLEERMLEMDATGVSRMVISPSTPGLQMPLTGFDFSTENLRTTQRAVNEHIASLVNQSGGRLRGMCSVFMRDIPGAIAELQWCQQAGFPGVLLNGAEHTVESDPPTPHVSNITTSPIKTYVHYNYYYKASLDFFRECVRLNMFVYLHPQCLPEPPSGLFDQSIHHDPMGDTKQVLPYSWNQTDEQWTSASCDGVFETGAPFGYQIHTAQVAATMIYNRVFEHVPGLQMVLGHQGEILPYILSRIDSMLMHEFTNKLDNTGTVPPVNFTETFRNHFHVTTSGFFDTAGLIHLLSVLPHDRILFSADTPFDTFKEATDWFNSLAETNPEIPCETLQNIAYKNAEKLLGWQ